MKELLKRLLPRRTQIFIKRNILTAREVRYEYRQDGARFLRHMVRDRVLEPETLGAVNVEAQITKDYHAVEKGLSLPSVKRPFGLAVGERISTLLPAAPPDADYTEHAIAALKGLNVWNEDEVLTDRLAPLLEQGDRGIISPDRFFTSRHSVRNFGNVAATPAELDYAVGLALQTPSVCNRQSWRVRFYQGDDVSQVLAFQNGNAGFREKISTVALVTVDVRWFTGVIERNQPWIDGGMFAMTLVWSLHSIGLDTCLLNMSVTNSTAEAMRLNLGIDDAEVPITMIAIGHAAEGARHARSPRKTTEEIRVSTDNTVVRADTL